MFPGLIASIVSKTVVILPCVFDLPLQARGRDGGPREWKKHQGPILGLSLVCVAIRKPPRAITAELVGGFVGQLRERD